MIWLTSCHQRNPRQDTACASTPRGLNSPDRSTTLTKVRTAAVGSWRSSSAMNVRTLTRSSTVRAAAICDSIRARARCRCSTVTSGVVHASKVIRLWRAPLSTAIHSRTTPSCRPERRSASSRAANRSLASRSTTRTASASAAVSSGDQSVASTSSTERTTFNVSVMNCRSLAVTSHWPSFSTVGGGARRWSARSPSGTCPGCGWTTWRSGSTPSTAWVATCGTRRGDFQTWRPRL